MSILNARRAEPRLLKLAVPIYLENLLRSAFSSADIFMLSKYNEQAVAAVGLVASFTFFLILLYSMISSGTTVLVSQYLGAGMERKAGDSAVASFVLGILFSLTLSVALCLGTDFILSWYTLETAVREYARQYLVIYGAGSVFVAFNIIQSNILRAYGHAKDSMIANLAANVLNIGGNALALFGPEWFPFRGVVGVALATVASQAVACFIMAILIRGHRDVHIPWRDIFKIKGETYKKLLSIGVPTAGENLSYNIMNIIIGIPISQYGTAALNANTYLNTVLRFVYMPALSIGWSGQIKTGYLIGAKKFETAKHRMYRYYWMGMAISMTVMILVFLFKDFVFGLFTQDPLVLGLLPALLLICFFREAGRIANVVVIPGLKGAGDVRFPVVIGVLSMWGIGALGGILLGSVAGLGLAGIWIAIALDEIIRGLIMIFRWRSGVWYSKRMVEDEQPEPILT
jgi:putative MATE family efflux protein